MNNIAPEMSGCDLVLNRLLNATPERLFKAWKSELKNWWGPHGMTIPCCVMDMRPGGIFHTVMRAPDGHEYHTKGVFLEVVENERIVFTDAFAPGWKPASDIFFVSMISFAMVDRNLTKFTVKALHWTAEDKARHEQMGFYQAWGESLDRLANHLRNDETC